MLVCLHIFISVRIRLKGKVCSLFIYIKMQVYRESQHTYVLGYKET